MTDAPAPLVLIVDDARDSRDMLTDVLELEGMRAFTADSGRDAVRHVSEAMPDIVLMDAVMPGMDGFETTSVLKRELGLSDLPILFMTGQNQSDHVVRAFECGGVDFIVKPIVIAELLARMRVHLTNAKRSQSARDALDSTGRRIVAADRDGAVRWATPQATALLSRVGIRAEDGAMLPWDLRDWLGDAGAGRGTRFVLQRYEKAIEFQKIGEAGGEILLRLIDQEGGSAEGRLARAYDLSPREAEVLTWIAHGKANKDIADILGLAPRTVNKHAERLFERLGVENRTAAAMMAVRILWE